MVSSALLRLHLDLIGIPNCKYLEYCEENDNIYIHIAHAHSSILSGCCICIIDKLGMANCAAVICFPSPRLTPGSEIPTLWVHEKMA